MFKNASVLLSAVLMFGSMSAHAALSSVGPVDPATGFPLYYEDSSGLRLQACLDPLDLLCLEPEGTDPTLPISFPGNFPDEFFWWTAEATVPTPAGDLLLVLALEGAFANDVVEEGERVVFGRIRIRGGGLDAGVYRVTHPYGVETFTVNAPGRRQINFTEDVEPIAQNFNAALGSRIGPFLVWDPAVAPAAPAGYAGSPNRLHPVVGSPFGTNFLRIERVIGNTLTLISETRFFAVSGKLL